MVPVYGFIKTSAEVLNRSVFPDAYTAPAGEVALPVIATDGVIDSCVA
jgi:hypothetical protein